MKDEELDDLAAIGRKPTWLLALLLFAILAGAGFLGWKMLTALSPTRVLVAIDVGGHWFEGAKPAAQLADRLNGQLELLGFEPVRPGDPETLAALDGTDDLRAAARKLGAAYVVSGRLTPELTKHDVGEGYHSMVLSGHLEVAHADDESAQRGELYAWSGAPKAEQAMSLAVRSAASQAAASAIPLLLAHPVVAELLQSDVTTMGQLRKAEKFAQLRSRELSTAEKTYAAYEARRKRGEAGPAEVSYHGPMSTQDRLGGAGPNGFLVMTEDIQPFVTPRNTRLSYYERLETLEWRRPDGSSRSLWQGYNVYSYPAASNDGRAAAFVEDIFGVAKTITVVGSEGDARRVVVDEAHRFSTPRPSADGVHVAAYDRECRRCDDGLLVLRVSDGARLFAAGHEGGVFGGYAWLDRDRLALLHTPTTDATEGAPPRVFAAERQTVWVLDLTKPGPKPQALFTVPEGTRLRQISTNATGELLVFAARTPEGTGVALLPVAAPDLVMHAIGERVDWPRLSPDGRRLTFSIGRRSAEDIAVLPITGGAPTRLTKNPTRDRYPFFAADGGRIFFEALGDDPNFPRRRHSFVASVPSRP